MGIKKKKSLQAGALNRFFFIYIFKSKVKKKILLFLKNKSDCLYATGHFLSYYYWVKI